jgi:hypothetical protein
LLPPLDPLEDPLDPLEDPLDPLEDPLDPLEDPLDPLEDPLDPLEDPLDPLELDSPPEPGHFVGGPLHLLAAFALSWHVPAPSSSQSAVVLHGT